MLAAAALLAPAAPAAFHLISIREVYPGSAASPDSGYVELQMYASGQQFVGGHAVTVYNAGGTALGTFTFPSAVASGANQRTILVGDSGVESAFGVAPDLVDAGFSLPAAAGAACWNGTPDCVSWGAFTGATPSASGTPADPGGIPDGMALRRSIAPGCPTLLEAGDDSDDSATDFFDASPQPRNNASPVSESACTGPTTTIDSGPADPTNATGATFTYHTSKPESSFECRLDGAAFAACPAGEVSYAGPLAEGVHSFRVRARDASEVVGPAASHGWRVDTTAPATVVDSHPEDPSPGASASFTYHATEAGASFECRLAPDGFAPCPGSITYTELADGEYSFEVRAEDAAGNLGAATSFAWTVDNLLADMTPPETTIDSAPPDPSSSSTAAFTYHASEPESSFECSLDGAGFAACAAAGIEYTGLGSGAHEFRVRAIDPAENVDPTPAGYSFEVVLATPAPAPTPTGAESGDAPSASPDRPQTRIVRGPRRRTRDRTPTLRFRADVRPARFQCSLDRQGFRRCRSPFTTPRLPPGWHRFRVRAIGGGGIDPTPARRVFKVLGERRRKARAR